MGGIRNNPEKDLQDANLVLGILNKYRKGEHTNLWMIAELGIEQSRFYGMKRRLKKGGRIDRDGKVINSSPLSMNEFLKIPSPYVKEGKAKKGKKKKKAVKKTHPGIWLPNSEGKTTTILPDPIELPVMTHKDGAEITIKIGLEDLAGLIVRLVMKGGER